MIGLRGRFIALAVLYACLCGCGAPPPPASQSGAVSAAVQRAHAARAAAADLADPAAFADALRGLVAEPEGQVRGEDGRVIWDFEAFDFVAGDPPPTVDPSLWRQARLNKHAGLFEVRQGIWQLRGFDLANLTLIEGASGWIVVDTLTARETAAAAMAFARKHLGDKPVTGIVYTHSHADHFGGALGVLSAAEARERAVPVVAPAGFMEEATSENLMMGGAMPRRSQYMYGDRLPRSATGLVDNGLGKAVAYGRIGLLPPTLLIEAPRQELVIDGVRFIFHDVGGSEAPSEFVFELPDLRAFCGSELMGHTLHNLYTLRGAKVRDALRWANLLDASLEWSADAEVLFNQHHWPVWGHAGIAAFIAHQRDAYRYIHDQTVRQINAGLTGPEIAETLDLPPALRDYLSVRGYYGTVRHNARAVYQFYMGWYDAHPANLDALPPVAMGERYVQALGGAERVRQLAQIAYDAGDFRWAAELGKHAVYADPDDSLARELLARSFEQMAYLAESGPWRNVYLSGALELREGAPEAGMSPTGLRDMLEYTPIERFLDRMAASIDGPAAEGLEITVNLQFSDRDENHVLQLKDCVLHHHRGAPDPQADATLVVTHAFFLDMMTGQVGASDLLTSSETDIEGSRIDLARLLGLVQKSPGNFPIVTR